MKTAILTILIAMGIAFACSASDKRTAIVVAYKTKRGDTLDSIAKRFRMKPEEVSVLNPKLKFDQLQIGQPIRVRLKNADTVLLYPTIPPRIID